MTPRTRTWVAVGALPVALIALALVVKLLSMYVLAQTAIAAHARNDATGAIRAAEALQPANWFEPWKAPYNLGVAFAGAGLLAESRGEFERALPLAQGVDACPVHINLALVIERMGDRARTADPERAAQLYADALEVSADTPAHCRTDEARQQSPDPERDPAETLDELVERLRGKLQQDQAPEDEGGPDDGDARPDGDSLDEIEERLQNGQRSRDELREDRAPDEGTDTGGRPW